jgi:hypothetical protein
MSRVLLAAAAVVLTFFVARLTVATTSEPHRATPSTASVRAEPIAHTSAVAQPSIARDEAPGPEAAPAPTREATPKLAQQANQLVDRAFASGQWRSTDRMQLVGMLGQLSEAEANEVLGKLFTSINAGRLAVESTPL